MPPKKKSGPPDTAKLVGKTVQLSRNVNLKIGDIIGKGAFGTVHRATSETGGSFVVKLEPCGSMGLFGEQKALTALRLTQWDQTERNEFTRKYHLDELALPKLHGYTTHTFTLDKGNVLNLRLLVIEGYKAGLLACLDKMNWAQYLELGRQMLFAYEYIHSRGWSHGDLKAENICTNDLSGRGQFYLIDFGANDPFCVNDVAKPYNPTPNKGYNGTLLFTSIDAHNLALNTARGDLEILLYNIIHWATRKLPWAVLIKGEMDVVGSNKVAAAKAKYNQSVGDKGASKVAATSGAIDLCNDSFGKPMPKFTLFIAAVFKLAYHETPNYVVLRELLAAAVSDTPTLAAVAGGAKLPKGGARVAGAAPSVGRAHHERAGAEAAAADEALEKPKKPHGRPRKVIAAADGDDDDDDGDDVVAVVAPTKKSPGRPPKAASKKVLESTEEVHSEEKPKRRGRPPKEKTVEAASDKEENGAQAEEKPKRPRGRPPKVKRVLHSDDDDDEDPEELSPQRKPRKAAQSANYFEYDENFDDFEAKPKRQPRKPAAAAAAADSLPITFDDDDDDDDDDSESVASVVVVDVVARRGRPPRRNDASAAARPDATKVKASPKREASPSPVGKRHQPTTAESPSDHEVVDYEAESDDDATHKKRFRSFSKERIGRAAKEPTGSRGRGRGRGRPRGSGAATQGPSVTSPSAVASAVSASGGGGAATGLSSRPMLPQATMPPRPTPTPLSAPAMRK